MHLYMAAKNGEIRMVTDLLEDEDDEKQCDYLKVALSKSAEEKEPQSTNHLPQDKNWTNQDVPSCQCTSKIFSSENVEWDNSSFGEWHKVRECHGNQGCKSLCHGNLVSKWSDCFPPTPNRCIKAEKPTASPNCHQNCCEFDQNFDSVEAGTDLTEFWDDEYDFLLKDSPRKVIGKFSVECSNKLEDKKTVLLVTNENKKSLQSSCVSIGRKKHRSLRDVFCRGKQFIKNKVSYYKNKVLNRELVLSGREHRAGSQGTSDTAVEKRKSLMSSEENQCNEINCDKPRVNGFSCTADEIRGRSENQVIGPEGIGSGDDKRAKRRSRDLICDEDVISNGILSRAAEDVHKKQTEEEEEFPLGSEALSLTVERSTPSKQPVDKRLGWLLSDSANTSIGSDFSHNSDISLDMLLSERSRDPEEILTNLGFVDQSEDTEADDLQRLPERFLEQQSSAKGIDVGALDVNRLLNLSEHEEMLEQINNSKMNAEFAEQGHPQLGNVLASVMNGMKFLNAINQSHNPSRNSSFDSRHSDDSVLQHPKNREYLDKQGFYKRHEKKFSKTETAASPSQSRLDRSQSLDATERRKMFHQTRSRNFSQLLESEESNLSGEKFPSRESRDSSLFRSVTSMEYSDSFESTEGREDSLEKRNKMGMLGVHSDDDWDMVRPAVSLGDISKSLISKKAETEKETSVKEELIEAESSPTSFRSVAYSSGLQKLQEMRKSLVNKSMASYDLDDDYEVTSPPLSKQSSLESTLTAKEFRMKTSSSCTLKNESLDTDDQVDSVFTVEDAEKLPRVKSPGHVSFSDLKIPELMLNAGSLPASDKDSLGGMGRMESIQSDSSGFAEGDMSTDHHREADERVSSLGSSAESDQTSKSNVTVIASHNQQNLQRKLSVGKDKTRSKVEKVDVAVGTEDIHQSVDSGIEQSSPSITYHFQQKEEGMASEDEAVEDGSVLLTIQLPKDWLNGQGKSTTSVVSHLYKHIGISSQTVPSASKSASHADIRTGCTSTSQTQPEKIQTDPTKSDTMRSHLNPRWASTPSIVFTHKQSNKPYDSSSQRYSKKRLFTRAPVRENGLGGGVGETYMDKTDSEMSSSFDKDSECSFISNTDSYSSLRDENVEYVKLVRLVNKPMSFKTAGYTPSRYRPNLRSLPHMDKQQYLEEESRLLQHALQKYKRELQAMETTFQANSQLAGKELTEEEREEIEEFQSLWKDVRREITEMEQLIANRLGGLVMGNDNYNPLLVLDIIHKMIDLIREQLFQHQLSLNKEEMAAMETSTGNLLRDGSVSHPQSLYSDESFQESLSDLKESILQEVRQELQDNAHWLQREIQNKDRELNKLRMEVMSQSIDKGRTRQKHYYETDV